MATSVPVAPIQPAIANRAIKFSAPLVVQYLREEASIEAIVSPQIVIVVFGAPYVEGIETIAQRTVLDSVHLITIHLETYAVTSQVTVNVVFAVLVGVHGIRAHIDLSSTVQVLSALKSCATQFIVSNLDCGVRVRSEAIRVFMAVCTFP